MVDSLQLQSKYTKLYRTLIRYTWNFNTIQTLADFEVEVYTTFPDMQKLKSKLNQLKMCILPVYFNDEDIQSAYDDLEDTLNSSDETYVKLNRVQEVISK